MGKRDYYEVLLISKNATKQEIKKAFRNLAKKYHPDSSKASGDTEEKFKEINEAYEILSDDTKRKKYDSMGHIAFEQAGGFEGFQGFSNMGDFGDIFSSFFGGRSQQKSKPRPTKGDDYQLLIQITFLDSVLGITKIEKLEKWTSCTHCYGSGAESKANVQTCSTCNGNGTVIRTTNSIFGKTEIRKTCGNCSGLGEKVTKVCHQCYGKKTISKIKEVSIKIPAGIKNGQTIVVNDYGGPGYYGGPPGNLYLLVRVKEHKFYTRKNQNIHLTIPVSIADVLTEKLIEVPTPYGNEFITIPKHISSGQTIILKDKGILGGNLILHIELFIPKISSKELKNISQNLEKVKDKSRQSWLRKFK